jgi:tight adherence protein C
MVSSLLLAAAVFLIALTLTRKIVTDQRRKIVLGLPKYTLHEDGEIEAALENDKTKSIIYKLGAALVKTQYAKFLTVKLQSSGRYGSSALVGTVYQKALYGLAGLMLGAVMLLGNPGTGLLYFIGLPLLGFFVPDILLYNFAAKRVVDIDKHLPDAIDLLNLCVESGLSFEAAASRVSLGLDGPVAEEFGALMGEMQLGKSRSEAIQELSDRTKSPDFLRFLTSMLQVDRLGVPISTVLREQAHEMRMTRKDKAREQAQKVTIKVLMPLMLCLLPAMFIIVIGPAMVRLIGGFLGMK